MKLENTFANKSKQLSWLLRHAPKKHGLQMDESGWVAIDSLVEILKISHAELKQIVNTNDKGRFQLVGQRVRACQGHSVNNCLVTRDALEASWKEYIYSTSLWHGTTVDAVKTISYQGILPIERTHVHCAPACDSIVGKRTNVAVIFEISPVKVREAGLDIFVASNGVVLLRSVPLDAIINLVALTKRAKKREAELRGYLGFDSFG